MTGTNQQGREERLTRSDGIDARPREESVEALSATPGLLFIGLVALGVGVAAGLVMSAVSLFR